MLAVYVLVCLRCTHRVRTRQSYIGSDGGPEDGMFEQINHQLAAPSRIEAGGMPGWSV